MKISNSSAFPRRKATALALMTGFLPLAALTLSATSAHAQSGSRSWTGDVDTDYYNGANWNAAGDFPNGNVTCVDSALTGAANTTIDRATGTYNYIFGLYFNNTLGTQNSYTINGTQGIALGGTVIRTAEVTSGSLTDVIDADIADTGGADVWDIRANHHLDMNGVYSGGSTTTKIGGGTLTFNGANTYTGATFVNAGKLQLGNGGAAGSLATTSAITVAGGATFSINQNDTVTQGTDFSAAAIAGNGTVDVKGGATVVLTDAATFADTLVVTVESGSTLDLDFVGSDTITSLDDGSGFVAAGVWGSGTSGAPNVSAALTGSGTLTVTSSGPPAPRTWDGSDDLTWTGPSDSTSWSGDSYNNGDFATFGDTGAGAVAISGTVEPGSVTVDSASDYTFSGDPIGGIGTLAKSGAGKLTLDSANTYSGVTTITGGQIRISNADALGTTAGETIIGNATKLEPVGDLTIAEPITNQGGGGGKIQSVSGTQTFTAPITLEAGMDIRGNDYVFQGGFTSAGNSAPGFNGSRYTVETTPITVNSGTFGLTSAGNNPANATHLNVGGNVWGLMRINFGGYLTLGVANALPAAAGVEFGWNTDGQSSGSLDLNGFDQTIGFLRQTANFPATNGDQNVTGGGTLTIDIAAGIYDYHGRITDGATATSIVKNGLGTQILNNQSGTPSNYSGTFEIIDGVVESLSGDDFSDLGSVKVTSTTTGALNLNYTGTDQIGALDLGAGNLPEGVYGAGDPADTNGVLVGTGTLTVVTPPASLTWDGTTDTDWTAPDTTSWSGGTYTDGDLANFGDTGAGTVNVSGTVEPGDVSVNSAADYTFSGDAIGGATGLTKSGAGVLTLASANTYTGVTTVSGGVLTVGDNAALGDLTGNTVVDGGSLRMEGGISLAEPLDISGGSGAAPALWSTAGANTVTGLISGNGRIQTEAGTMTLSGGISSATTSILVGDFVVDTTPITVTGMNLAGDSFDIGDPSHVAGRKIVLNAVTGTHDWDYSLLFFSAIVELGATDVMPTDAGVRFGWTTVPNSFSRLDLKSFDQTVASIETVTQSIDVGGDVEITGSGTLTVNQATSTEYQGRLTGGLSLVKNGAGTLTLNNLSGTPTSYTGDTTVNDGTLVLNTADLADGSTVAITDGGGAIFGTLQLDHGVTDTVAGLIFGTTAQAPGLYNAGNSGGYITGTGSILVSTGGANFASWATTNGVTGGVNGDSDNDGNPNGLEYALDITIDGYQAAGTFDGTTLSFTKRAEAVTNGDVTYSIEESDDLGVTDPWTAVTATTNDATTIAYDLPTGAGEIYARLNVVIAP